MAAATFGDSWKQTGSKKKNTKWAFREGGGAMIPKTAKVNSKEKLE